MRRTLCEASAAPSIEWQPVTAAGTPLVLLHAFPLDRRMWRPQLDALEPTRPVVAPDLPGFGTLRSTPPTPELDLWADAVEDQLANVLGRRPAVVCGLSMGGYVALRLAARHPERLAGLVLADSRAAADSPESRTARATSIAAIREHGLAAFVDSLVPRLVSPAATTELRASIRALALAQSPATVVRALCAMRDRPDSRPVLAGLRAPVAVIVGEHDLLSPPVEAAAIAAAIDGAVIEVVAGAGHLASLEAPESFNAALARFLARVDGLSR